MAQPAVSLNKLLQLLSGKHVKHPMQFYRCMSTAAQQQRLKDSMQAWTLRKYDSLNCLKRESIDFPRIGPDEILVKVEASSVNPLDIEMAKGYGRGMLNSLRKIQGISEFPLVLGRDCSGTVVERGRTVRRFSIGDEVWCARWLIGPGTHAEYVRVKLNEASKKPSNLSHSEAASMPFVACTVCPSLISRGGLTVKKPGKRVLVLGGNGGIGTFTIQLARAMGANVSSTARAERHKFLQTLGAADVFDYTDPLHVKELQSCKPFDIIMDCRRGPHDNKYRLLLAKESLASYISFQPPVLRSMDQKGIAMGFADSAAKFIGANTSFFEGKGIYSWGYYFPTSGILKQVKTMVEKMQISPVVDSVYSFSDAHLAYERVSKGGAIGKVVISTSDVTQN